jgi:glycerol-3-phosphate acyltransferase PlsY
MASSRGIWQRFRAIVAIAAAGYLLGSIPFAGIIGHLHHVDPRREGDRNPGAWNVWALAGRRAGIIALLLDMGKGAAAAGLGLRTAGWGGGLVGTLGAMTGHAWPIWSGLREGGRSVAVLVGAGSVLAPGPALVSWTICLTSLPLGRPRLSVSAGVLSYPLALGVITRDWSRFGGITLTYLFLVVRHITLRRQM